MDKADNTPVKGVQEDKNQKDMFSLKGEKYCLNKTELKAHTE